MKIDIRHSAKVTYDRLAEGDETFIVFPAAIGAIFLFLFQMEFIIWNAVRDIPTWIVDTGTACLVVAVMLVALSIIMMVVSTAIMAVEGLRLMKHKWASRKR